MADSGRDDKAEDTIRIVPVSWDDDSARPASAEPEVPPASPEREASALPAPPETATGADMDTIVLTRPVAAPVPAGSEVADRPPQWIMWSAVASAALVGIAVLIGAGLYLFGGLGQAGQTDSAPQGATYTVPDPQSGYVQPGGAVAPSAVPSPGAASGVGAGDTSGTAGAGASQATTDETSCADNLAQTDSVIQDYYKAKGAWPVTMADVQRFSGATPRCPNDDSAYYYNPYTHEVTCPNGHTATKPGSTGSP